MCFHIVMFGECGRLHFASHFSHNDSNVSFVHVRLSFPYLCRGDRCPTWHTAASGEGEFYHPVTSAFRVKLVRNEVLSEFLYASGDVNLYKCTAGVTYKTERSSDTFHAHINVDRHSLHQRYPTVFRQKEGTDLKCNYATMVNDFLITGGKL